MSSLQCLKRVHLEIHRKDLLEYSKATEASFAIGHEVGDMAIRLYGRGRGTEIEYGKGNLSQALATTRDLMTSGKFWGQSQVPEWASFGFFVHGHGHRFAGASKITVGIWLSICLRVNNKRFSLVKSRYQLHG